MRHQITQSRCGRDSEAEKKQWSEGTCGGGSLGCRQRQGTVQHVWALPRPQGWGVLWVGAMGRAGDEVNPPSSPLRSF